MSRNSLGARWRKTFSLRLVTPKGLHLSAQGCRTRLPWVTVSRRVRVRCWWPTPEGLRPTAAVTQRGLVSLFIIPGARGATPLGLGPVAIPRPKVGEYDNLGL